MSCSQELCPNWTGEGCICAVLDLPRPDPLPSEAGHFTGCPALKSNNIEDCTCLTWNYRAATGGVDVSISSGEPLCGRRICEGHDDC